MRARGILLAAGRGTRLRPLTDVLPKPALPLLDVPLGARGLIALRRAGLRPLINSSHLADELERALGPYAPDALWLREPPEPFGTAGTLREARAAGLLDDDLVIWNSDVIADVDPATLLDEHRRSGAAATVVVQTVAAGADFAVDTGRASAFIDRRDRPDDPGARFSGISAISSEALDLIPPAGPAGLGESILRPLAQRGELEVVAAPAFVADVGTLGAYLETSHRLLAAPEREPATPGKVVDARGGRAYIGPGARAARGTLGRGAVLLTGAVADPGAEVEEAIVWPGGRVRPGETAASCVWFRDAALRP